jgi:hypothetical protein
MPGGKTDVHNLVRAAILALPEVSTKRMFGADAFYPEPDVRLLFDEAIVLRLPIGS